MHLYSLMPALTSTVVLEVWAAVAHVEAVVVAVAGRVVGVHDDRVDVGLGDAAVWVLALAALPRLPAAAHQGARHGGAHQEAQEHLHLRWWFVIVSACYAC